MALLEYVDREEATGRARELLEEHEAEHGSALRPMLANHPPLLEAQMVYHERIMESGDLERPLKELVGVVVSQANACEYCVSSHRENLHALGIPPERLAAVADGEYGSLSGRERAAVEFAGKAATDPHRITEADLEPLRAAGFDDANVLELLGVVGMFMAANTYMNALSVHPADRGDDLAAYLDPSTLEGED